MKIPNFGYHFARWEGDLRRKAYCALLPMIVSRKIAAPRSLPLEVYSYSGEATLPEQVRSIRSFLSHAGRPKRFVVTSDGTYSARSLELLRQIDPVVSIQPASEGLPADLPEKFRRYITTHPMGRQLGLTLTLPRGSPALYVDSDVLFFPGAIDLLEDIDGQNVPALYLPDCQDCSADPRIFRQPNEASRPVNCGFLALFSPLDWSVGISRYLELKGEPTFFTNQTIAHVVMHANRAEPFDPNRYVLQLDDQFIYPDCHASRRLVLRHYVNPVRHKFWTV